jgi:hypothetical protein
LFISILACGCKKAGVNISNIIEGGHFIGLSISDKYIYALYSLKDKDASVQDKFRGNTIFVFDWEGKPIKKFVMDCDVKAIEVSDDEKRIYAIFDNPDPEIIYFEL